MRDEERVFDASAMGDLAFLLLIFFIVTSSFILRQGIFFSLPSNSAGAVKVGQSRIIDVHPRKNGFSVNGMAASREELVSLLLLHRKRVKDPVMIIHMREGLIYDRFIDTLSTARETGIKRVSLREE